MSGVNMSECTHDPQEIEAIKKCVAQIYIRCYRNGTWDLESFYRRRAEKQMAVEARGR